MAEPPYDIMGNGAPTIGSKPNTMDIFIATYEKKAEAKSIFENTILATDGATFDFDLI